MFKLNATDHVVGIDNNFAIIEHNGYFISKAINPQCIDTIYGPKNHVINNIVYGYMKDITWSNYGLELFSNYIKKDLS